MAFLLQRWPAIRHLARFSIFPLLVVGAAAAVAGASAAPFSVTTSCLHLFTSAVAGALRTFMDLSICSASDAGIYNRHALQSCTVVSSL